MWFFMVRWIIVGLIVALWRMEWMNGRIDPRRIKMGFPVAGGGVGEKKWVCRFREVRDCVGEEGPGIYSPSKYITIYYPDIFPKRTRRLRFEPAIFHILRENNTAPVHIKASLYIWSRRRSRASGELFRLTVGMRPGNLKCLTLLDYCDRTPQIKRFIF